MINLFISCCCNVHFFLLAVIQRQQSAIILLHWLSGANSSNDRIDCVCESARTLKNIPLKRPITLHMTFSRSLKVRQHFFHSCARSRSLRINICLMQLNVAAFGCDAYALRLYHLSLSYRWHYVINNNNNENNLVSTFTLHSFSALIHSRAQRRR